VAATIEHESVLRRGDWQSVVDIGANRGQFALACRRCCPQARVFSFEPLARPAASFEALFSGDSIVSLTRAAIGPDRQRASMHVASRDDSSSLLPISDLQTAHFPGTEQAGIEAVDVAPLRAFLDADDLAPPALLKIDVQGFELKVLEACKDLLDCFRAIYVECSFVELYDGQALASELILWLSHHGFMLERIYNPVCDRDNAMIQADFLFVTSST
jgi:FkbM family methyltransferase